MNPIHFLIDYIKGLNPASQWSSSSREGRKVVVPPHIYKLLKKEGRYPEIVKDRKAGTLTLKRW